MLCGALERLTRALVTVAAIAERKIVLAWSFGDGSPSLMLLGGSWIEKRFCDELGHAAKWQSTTSAAG